MCKTHFLVWNYNILQVAVSPYRLTAIVNEDRDGKIYILVYSQSNY